MKAQDSTSPCEGCPALTGGSYTVSAGETAITPVGDSFRIISVYTNGNMAGFSSEDISVSDQRFSIQDCMQPEVTTREIRRNGLAGLIGLKRTVTVATCPAVHATKISTV